jgi:hypothetical protein
VGSAITSLHTRTGPQFTNELARKLPLTGTRVHSVFHLWLDLGYGVPNAAAVLGLTLYIVGYKFPGSFLDIAGSMYAREADTVNEHLHNCSYRLAIG